MLPAAAEARGKEFGVKAQSVEALLANPDIDVIINLTIPAAHFAVSKAGLEAGKHVYSEKPLVLSIAEGLNCVRSASVPAGRWAARPTRSLGGAHQQRAR